MSNNRADDRDDRFQPSVGSPRQGGQSFITQVIRQSSKAGARHSGRHQPGARLGRGHVAARLQAGRPDGRRVTIKTRLVNLQRAGHRSSATHLRYIEREGVGRSGEPGHAYGPATDRADLDAFDNRGKNDRHQFRFIVSPEDADSLRDLRTFTRHMMERVESDLGTHLDWVAVDHWNTDNPHTHVVLRGKDDAGRDLVIARDYIAHGMRMRAGELATEWLGPRTEREILHARQRNVSLDRLTDLDRTLLNQGGREGVHLCALSRHPHRQELIGRLQHLQRLGLAHEIKTGHWHLESSTEQILRAMGERGDIVRTMQRAMGSTERELSIDEAAGGDRTVVGRLVAKGLAGQMHDQGYLVVDGTDGKAHHLRLAPTAELSNYPVGAVIEARPAGMPRAIDQQLVSLSQDGWYERDRHQAVLMAKTAGDSDHDFVLDAHERRLEALRRAGIVERSRDGRWRIPGDLVEHGQRHDAQRTGDLSITVRATLPLAKQTRAIGATWLDAQLLARTAPLANRGFGAEVHTALTHRAGFLVEQGLAKRRDQQLVFTRNLLATLREREIKTVGHQLAEKMAKPHRLPVDGVPIQGIYRRRIELVSGQYALLEDTGGFSLVPWKPLIEQKLGQSISAVVRGSQVSWQLGRARGLSIN